MSDSIGTLGALRGRRVAELSKSGFNANRRMLWREGRTVDIRSEVRRSAAPPYSRGMQANDLTLWATPDLSQMCVCTTAYLGVELRVLTKGCLRCTTTSAVDSARLRELPPSARGVRRRQCVRFPTPHTLYKPPGIISITMKHGILYQLILRTPSAPLILPSSPSPLQIGYPSQSRAPPHTEAPTNLCKLSTHPNDFCKTGITSGALTRDCPSIYDPYSTAIQHGLRR